MDWRVTLISTSSSDEGEILLRVLEPEIRSRVVGTKPTGELQRERVFWYEQHDMVPIGT